MIVTVTERATFMRCRQQWAWASFNGAGYQPIVSKPALAIGRLWHAVQAEWSLHPEQDPNQIVLTLSNDEIERISAAYLVRIGAPISELELEPVYTQIKMVVAMVHNYYKRWGTPLPNGFTMVAPEQTCVVPIPGTEHVCEECVGRCWVPANDGYENEITCPTCQGQGSTYHFLEGTLDGLIRDDFGRVYVLERKTYGQRPKMEVLNMQDQFLAYLWILRTLNIGDVGGLAYDGAWKRESPTGKNTLEDLFLRVRLSRSKSELDRFPLHLAAQANDMANNPAIYINRRWDGCWDCDFVEPCIAQERGESHTYLLDVKFQHRPRTEDLAHELKHSDD